jgi:tRNA A64-2'-O-ribosylphosphate transferase
LSEHAQISTLLPLFLSSLNSLGLDLDIWREKLTKPLRPLWITPDTQLVAIDTIFEDARPVICCTASARTASGELASVEGYVQGAGDDTETWALGLTAPMFWEFADLLLDTSEADLPGVIKSLVESDQAKSNHALPRWVAPGISVCRLPLKDATETVGECRIVLLPGSAPFNVWTKTPTRMEVGLGRHSAGSRNLRKALPHICAFVGPFLEKHGESGRVLIACESGRDHSVGTALALLCRFQDSFGQSQALDRDSRLNKTIIRAKLGHIMTMFPEANPHRATLQSVNSFLIDLGEIH